MHRDPRASGAAGGPESGGGFRPEIEGLRAVAVGAVLLDHAGVPLFSGGYVGVDVFFVISGFLITRMLVDEVERTGSISMIRFYARRIRRLLPSAMTLLIFVALGSALLLSAARCDQVSGDLVASGLYVVNWRFAAQAVDYFGATLQASPVQHFWSLAVEEQFYIVWPALLIAVTWRRRGVGIRRAVWIALAAIGVASFAYGVHEAHTEAAAGYFSTGTRVWELALGGLLALGPGVLPRLPGRVVTVLGWGGLGAILLASVLYGDGTPFPGTAALLPTLGTAAIIMAGAHGTQARPLRLLTGRGVRHVGRVSYVWYLWHWPLLVFAAALWGHLSAWVGLAVVAVAWVPSVLTHRLIEEPARHSQALIRLPRRGLGLASGFAGATVCMGLLLPLTAPTIPTAPAGAVAGAAVVEHSEPVLQQRATAVRPNPRDAGRDRGPIYADGCLLGFHETISGPCVYGDAASKTTVVLFGDSHAMQYGPALDALAHEHGWRLVALTKEGCTPAGVRQYNSLLGRQFSECDTWRAGALKRIADQEHPAMVVTSTSTTYRVVQPDGTLLDYGPSTPVLRTGFEDTLRRLEGTGAKVVVVADPPRAPTDTADCVASSLDDLPRCAFAAGAPASAPAFDTQAAAAVPGVTLIDPQPMLCPGERCAAVIGSALVYRDAGHLTATFAATLAPWFDARLPAIGAPAPGTSTTAG